MSLQKRSTDIESLGKLGPCRWSIRTKGPEDGHADAIAEDVDRSLCLFGEGGTHGSWHSTHCRDVVFALHSCDSLVITAVSAKPHDPSGR
jgi:hypothetical protein